MGTTVGDIKSTNEQMALEQMALQPIQNLAYQELPSIENDLREYGLLTLDNGLKVLLIHNPTASISTALMNVNVGSYHENIPGLAHFLEHLLFCGSEKYPHKSDFHDFLGEHAGVYNGSTGQEETEFYYHVEHSHFIEVLDRFAQFFISPLFKKECVEDEINAMQEEFMGNIESDIFRILHIQKLLINPKHPESRFDWGNAETLKETETVLKEMRSFYETYYKADNMRLILESNLPLDELKNCAAKLFSGISKSKAPIPALAKIPFCTEAQMGRLVYQQSVQNNNLLIIDFAVNTKRTLSLEQALNYLKMLLCLRSPGSLLDHLLKGGWVQNVTEDRIGLDAEVDFNGDSQFELSLSYPLTERGKLEIPYIIDCVFQYVQFLEKHALDGNYYQFFKNTLAFNLTWGSDVSNTVFDFMKHLKEYPLYRFFVGSKVLPGNGFPKAELQGILEKLTPQNIAKVLILEDVEWEIEESDIELEPYTKTHFKRKPLKELIDLDSDRKLKSEKDGIPFTLNNPDRFIPSSFNLVSMSDSYNRPRLIHNENDLRIWLMQEKRVEKPMVITRGILKSFLIYSTPFNTALVCVLGELLSLELHNKLALDISFAHTMIKIADSSRGIHVLVDGFSHKHADIVKAVFALIHSLEINASNFEKVAKVIRERFTQMQSDLPKKQMQLRLTGLLQTFEYSPEEMIHCMDKMELKHLSEFWAKLKSQFAIELSCGGNISQDSALQLGKDIREMFKKDKDTDLNPKPRVIRLPQNQTYHSIMSTDSQNNAVLVFLQAPDNSLETKIIITLLKAIMEPYFFDIIRTQEKLAYQLECDCIYMEDQLGLYLYVENSAQSALFLKNKVALFLQDFKNYLQKLGHERLTVLKDDLDKLYSSAFLNPDTLQTYESLFSNRFKTGAYEFEEILDHLRPYHNITLDQLLDFYPKFSERQLHILFEHADNLDQLSGLENVITEVQQFKGKADLFPCSIEVNEKRFKERYGYTEPTQLNPILCDRRQHGVETVIYQMVEESMQKGITLYFEQLKKSQAAVSELEQRVSSFGKGP